MFRVNLRITPEEAGQIYFTHLLQQWELARDGKKNRKRLNDLW